MASIFRAVFYLSIIMLFQLQVYVKCMALLEKSYGLYAKKDQSAFLDYLNLIETRLNSDSDGVNESALIFLAILLKRMEELKACNNLKAPEYWHSRQGR